MSNPNSKSEVEKLEILRAQSKRKTLIGRNPAGISKREDSKLIKSVQSGY